MMSYFWLDIGIPIESCPPPGGEFCGQRYHLPVERQSPFLRAVRHTTQQSVRAVQKSHSCLRERGDRHVVLYVLLSMYRRARGHRRYGSSELSNRDGLSAASDTGPRTRRGLEGLDVSQATAQTSP